MLNISIGDDNIDPAEVSGDDGGDDQGAVGLSREASRSHSSSPSPRPLRLVSPLSPCIQLQASWSDHESTQATSTPKMRRRRHSSPTKQSDLVATNTQITNTRKTNLMRKSQATVTLSLDNPEMMFSETYLRSSKRPKHVQAHLPYSQKTTAQLKQSKKSSRGSKK